MTRGIPARVLGLVVAVLVATGLAPARGAAAASAVPDWLAHVNAVRTASGLQPLVEQPSWTAGIAAHLRYLKLTPAGYATGAYASAHTENPSSPYYSAAGDQAGRSSDLAFATTSAVQAIDELLAAPFHAVGILRPGLTQIAFYRDPTSGNAGLDIIRGITSGTPPTTPTLFPGSGSHISLNSFGGELPDPLESCSIQLPAGLPLIVLLPATPAADLTASLTDPSGTTVSDAAHLCVVDEHTYRTTDQVYGPTGADILSGDHAVFLVPSGALHHGPYTATIKQPGLADITWSFTVDTPDPQQPTSVRLTLSTPGPVPYGTRVAARARVRDSVTGAAVTVGTVQLCSSTTSRRSCTELPLDAAGSTRAFAVRLTTRTSFVADYSGDTAFETSSAASRPIAVRTLVSVHAARHSLVVRLTPAARTGVRLQRRVSGSWRTVRNATTTTKGTYTFTGLVTHSAYRVLSRPVAGRVGSTSPAVRPT